jgi:hypothetical protein
MEAAIPNRPHFTVDSLQKNLLTTHLGLYDFAFIHI